MNISLCVGYCALSKLIIMYLQSPLHVLFYIATSYIDNTEVYMLVFDPVGDEVLAGIIW